MQHLVFQPKLRSNSSQILQKCVERISSILEDLKLSHENKENRKLPVSAININNLLKHCISEKKCRYPESDLHINLELDSELCLLVSNDTVLTRVISNLLNNAIEASIRQPNRAEITVETLKRGSFGEIRIKDNGFGIDEHKIDRVFSKGVSIDKKNGMGLGLYHAKKNIEKMNGEIYISSKKNQGAVVSISLPVNQLRENAAGRSLEIKNSIIEKKSGREAECDILIHIEDEEIIRFWWREKIEEQGFKYIGQDSFESLLLNIDLDEISKRTPIYVDLNIDTSQHNGIETAKLLRKKGFHNIHLSTNALGIDKSDQNLFQSIISKDPSQCQLTR